MNVFSLQKLGLEKGRADQLALKQLFDRSDVIPSNLSNPEWVEGCTLGYKPDDILKSLEVDEILGEPTGTEAAGGSVDRCAAGKQIEIRKVAGKLNELRAVQHGIDRHHSSSEESQSRRRQSTHGPLGEDTEPFL